MKKIAAILLALTMLFCITSCKDNDDKTNSGTNVEVDEDGNINFPIIDIQ